MLGIPTVLDRLIQQALHQILSPLFEEGFSNHSYGFRPGRSATQAVQQARNYIEEGRRWVVDTDLEKFFDRVNHDILMSRVARKVEDKRILRLIRSYLQAGIMENGIALARVEGTPQGGPPLSPILSNIVLNELDHKLEDRNLGYCRWADDFVIVVRSERAAQRVMKGTIAYLEEELGLIVNREKSCVAQVKDITFLGFQILRGKIRVSTKAQARFKERVRGLTHRNNPLSMYQVIQELNKYLRGWVGYFGIQEFKYLFRDLDAWIRSRLRSTQLKRWKKPGKFQRIMIKAGFDSKEVHRVWIKMNRWQSVMRRPVRFVLNLEWFRERGVVFLHDFMIAFSRA